MPKIKIKVSLTTQEEKIEKIYDAIYKELEDCILYQEQDENKTLVKYDYKKQKLIRENKDFCMIYSFQKNKITKASIEIKELNQVVYLKLKTKEIKQEEKNMRINYQLEEEEYQYKIEVI